MESSVIVSNLPPVFIQWLGHLGLFIFGIAMFIIALGFLSLLRQISQILSELNKIVTDDVHRDLMPNVKAITENVKVITKNIDQGKQSITITINQK